MRWYVWQTRLRCVGVVSERRCQASQSRVGSAGLAGEHVLSTSTAPGGGRPVDCRSARASNTYINDDGRPEGGRDGRRRPHAGLFGAALPPYDVDGAGPTSSGAADWGERPGWLLVLQWVGRIRWAKRWAGRGRGRPETRAVGPAPAAGPPGECAARRSLKYSLAKIKRRFLLRIKNITCALWRYRLD